MSLSLEERRVGQSEAVTMAKHSRATMDRSHKAQQGWAPEQDLGPIKLHRIAFPLNRPDQGFTTLHVPFLQPHPDQRALVCKFYFKI